jgi:hypothetical protein
VFTVLPSEHVNVLFMLNAGGLNRKQGAVLHCCVTKPCQAVRPWYDMCMSSQQSQQHRMSIILWYLIGTPRNTSSHVHTTEQLPALEHGAQLPGGEDGAEVPASEYEASLLP